MAYPDPVYPDDTDDGASCGPDSCGPPTSPTTLLTTAFSLAPVFVIFLLVSSLALSRLHPRLSNWQQRQQQSQVIDDGQDHVLPASAPASLRQAHAEQAARSPRRRAAAAAFATTLGLAGVLAQLLLAEILDVKDDDGTGLRLHVVGAKGVADADPGSGKEEEAGWLTWLVLALARLVLLPGAKARATALRWAVPMLVGMLVVIVPLLEVWGVLALRGWKFGRDSRGRIASRAAWVVLGTVFWVWLVGFWAVGKVMVAMGSGSGQTKIGAAEAREMVDLASKVGSSGYGAGDGWLLRGCLERIGVIGIWLMALLSGFASVSNPWHTFVDGRMYRRRPITDADIARKQAGLDATTELLLSKRHRLRALQRKAELTGENSSNGGTGTTGMMGKVFGSLRNLAGGGGDAAEIRTLQMEIAGLEAMESNLASSLSNLRNRKAAHARDGTALGKLLAIPQYAFATYCVYRILATLLTTLRRAYYPWAAFSSSDPINRFLALLARHWDPALDVAAWARQISFLLSGAILAASASSAAQTARLFARWTPSIPLLRQAAQVNLPLLAAQVVATYVISAALMLRGSLPREVGRSVTDALEGALDPAFADRWFEGWFLVASAGTALGIWVGRKVGGSAGDDDWDDFAAEEMGQKRS
ncbi:hypothetical protein VTJ04DRAFT_825 [Mycothermus thermophilus]|uniref:uncharacterized protein n=1 Tax=Humicola insolens TaxID=85995 RepID=UPI0037425031